MPFDPDNVLLGKRLGVVHDPRTLRAAALMPAPEQLPRVPIRHRVGGRLAEVPLFGNDEYGDCTRASQGHAVVTQERSSSQHEIPITTDQILEAYWRVSGGVGVDNGAYELDALNDWRNIGIGRERDGSTHRIYAFAAVDWLDQAEVEWAHFVFGGLKVCAGLPLSAADQLHEGKDWTVTTGSRSNFGSWGGHSMYSCGYDPMGLYVWTWGRLQRMTWGWVNRYVDETYAVISEDYIRRGGKTPQGFNLDALDRYLKDLDG